jgi:hypothetical protein
MYKENLKKVKQIQTIKKICNDSITNIYINLSEKAVNNRSCEIKINSNKDFKDKYNIIYDIRTIQRVLNYLEKINIITIKHEGNSKIIKFLEQ